MPRLIKPRALRPGATVAIAAPCGPVDAAKLAAGVSVWEAAGHRVVHRGDITEQRGYLAGDDARRAAELTDWARDPEVGAIVCARGGYGCSRLFEHLDPETFRAARKPVVGYSDVTSLLLWLRRRAGLVGFHGPMLERGADVDTEAYPALVAMLRGEPSPPLRGRGVHPGHAEGRLVGGNLVLVAASLGTPWEVDTRGAILLLEEVGEQPYRIDRLLQQLRAAGKLDALAGIGLGAFEGCVDPRHPEPEALDVVAEITARLGVPVVADLPFGHVKHNIAWPLGARATIDGARGEVRVVERGVSKRP